MTISVTMTATRMGEAGEYLNAGETYDVTESFARYLVQFGWATATFGDRTGYTATKAYVTTDGVYQLLDHEGGVIALSDAPLRQLFPGETIPELPRAASGTCPVSRKTLRETSLWHGGDVAVPDPHATDQFPRGALQFMPAQFSAFEQNAVAARPVLAAVCSGVQGRQQGVPVVAVHTAEDCVGRGLGRFWRGLVQAAHRLADEREVPPAVRQLH